MVPARLLVREGAQRHGERLAVVSGRGRATYADLDVRSDRLAGALAQRGVKPGDRVVLFMGDSLEAVVAIVGALKAGAVLTPIDPATDAQQLAFVFDDCAASAVITEARLAAVAAAAMRASWSVRLVVLVGGDQGSISESCVAFDDAVGRGSAPLASPPEPAATHPLMLVYPRAAGGLAAPVTMTDGDVLPWRAGATGPVGSVVEAVSPIAGARGIAGLLAALAGGATVMFSSVRAAAPRLSSAGAR